MLMSVDGKISTGDADDRDIDKDLPHIDGAREGLEQYYELERWTDLWSLNTGRVFAKIGVNEKTDEPTKLPVSFVVIDSKPHLTESGVAYLAKKAHTFVLVTTNPTHPAHALTDAHPNLHVISYTEQIDFVDLFCQLKETYIADKLTVQSGGTLNTRLLRDGLIDRVLLVVAPLLIGGKDTASLLDGKSLHTMKDLAEIRTLELVQAKPLEHSYLLLEYKVRN